MKFLLSALTALVVLTGCAEQQPTPGEAYLADFKAFEEEVGVLAEQASVCITVLRKTFDHYDHLAPENQESFDTLFSAEEEAEYDAINADMSAHLEVLRQNVERGC
ncbi:hypothetical protein [Pseudidiomarina salilacus]|uniref:hypothetical protein n=1 Tax=Pseudidiomarina salilacus TaxID=3384452 RepID=UPI0039847C4A